MKKIALVSLMFLFAVAAFAQSEVATPKVVVVINRADWCPTCKANGPRVEKDIVAAYAGNENIVFVVNDLTSDATKATSKTTLEANGVYEAVSSIKSTGLIILVDVVTKKVIEQVAVAKSTEKIKKEIEKAIN
jgi:thiol-disulfide isomerase/thioredoxin